MSQQTRHNSTDLADNFEDQLVELTDLALKTIRQLMVDVKATANVRLKAALAILNRGTWTVLVERRKHADENLLRMFLGMGPRQPKTEQPPIARNALCPFKSGLKYKRCCGVAATAQAAQTALAGA